MPHSRAVACSKLLIRRHQYASLLTTPLRGLSTSLPRRYHTDRSDYGNISNNVATEAHTAFAAELAAASTVLLKNDGGLLPLATVGR